MAKPGKAEIYRATKKRWQARNAARGCLYRVERDARVRQATPPWIDRIDILRVYEEAERISAETGVPHEVDHFYPLAGKNSCGLHVPWNLKIITAIENRKKNNRSPEEFYAGQVET
jgi:5-methylcytosine-specific restriction endonuclease McrA